MALTLALIDDLSEAECFTSVDGPMGTCELRKSGGSPSSPRKRASDGDKARMARLGPAGKAFAKLNEQRLYKLLKTCMDTQTDLKTLTKTMVNI